MEVDYKDCHRKRYTGTQEDVGYDERPEGMLRIGQDFSDDAAGSGSYDGGDDGEQPGGGHA